MKTTLINKTTKTNQNLVINLEAKEFVAYLDGKEVARHFHPGGTINHKQHGKIHMFTSNVALTIEEGKILQAAYDAQPLQKIVTRETLVADYQSLVAEQYDAYERAHNNSDGNAMNIRDSYDAKIEAAEKAIRAYDAAHPRNTERSAFVERALRGED